MKLKIISNAFTLAKYMNKSDFVFAVRKLPTGLTVWFGKELGVRTGDGLNGKTTWAVIHNEKCMKAIKKALDGKPFSKWYIVIK